MTLPSPAFPSRMAGASGSDRTHLLHDQFSKKVVHARGGWASALTSYCEPRNCKQITGLLTSAVRLPRAGSVDSIIRQRQAPNSDGAYVRFGWKFPNRRSGGQYFWSGRQDGATAASLPLPAYSTSSFCIFVTTRLTNPLIALCTLEGLKVSVVPVQTSCPSGAPLT